MTGIYIGWYGFATALTVLVWRKTRASSYWKKALFRTGVLAFGYTTVPIFSPDGGLLYPIGLYFLSGDSWREAAGKASLVIGLVWLALFAPSIVLPFLASKLAGSTRGTRPS